MRNQVSPKLRWIAIATGLAAFCSLAVTLLYFPLPVLLIAGATMAGRWPDLGRLCMWVAALLLSLGVLPIAILFLLEPGKFAYIDLSMVIDLGFYSLLILLPLLDGMLVASAIKQRRPLSRQVSRNSRLPG